MFEIARAQGSMRRISVGPLAGVACARVVTWTDWLSFITYRALRLTDRSFEPPMGAVLRAIPSPQKDACPDHGAWLGFANPKPRSGQACGFSQRQ